MTDISVIIPYYNPDGTELCEILLERAIRSVAESLGSTCRWEILIVDDGSIRSPQNIVGKFTGHDIRLFTIQHQGLGGARNYGIETSEADMISFLDADDYYIGNRLALCVRHMKQSGLEFLHFNHKDIYGKNSVSALTKADNDCKPVFSGPVKGDTYMLHGGLFASSCLYITKRDILLNNGLRFVQGHTAEDEEFTPRLLSYCENTASTDIQVYAYCHRQGTITSPDNLERRIADALYALKNLCVFRDNEAAFPHPGLDRKIDALAIDIIRLSLRHKEWKKYSRHVVETLKCLGLYPINKSFYSLRHYLLAITSSSKAGRLFLKLAGSDKQ